MENTEHSIMSETVTTAPVLLQGTALPAPKDVIAEEETTGEQMVIAVTKIDSVVARDAQEQSKEFTVRFDARELAWFKITVDDKEPFEIMLRAGQSYRKTAGRSMKVRIGNAGGLSLFFNDIPIGVPGEHGKPLNLQFPEAAEGL